MIKWIYVFVGGGLGSLLRYAIGVWLNSSPYFMPYGTFTVNVTGSFIIGLAGGLSTKHFLHNPALLYFLMAGFLGGFTTFSSFTFETLNMLRDNNWPQAFVYVSTTLITGLLAVAFGFYVSKFISG
jgi:CrcB protein